MRIAVVSFYAVTNIGDKILTDTVCWFLKNSGYRYKIVDLNGRYFYRFSGFIGKIERLIVGLFIRRETSEQVNVYFLRKLCHSSLILFAGGAILDTKITNCSERIFQIIKIAEQYKIPVVFNSVGLCGNDYNSIKGVNLLYSLSSNIVKSISVRERISDVNKYLIKETINNKAILVSDTAVWCSECYGIKASKKARKNLRIGINVTSYKNYIYKYPNIKKEFVLDVYVRIFKSLKLAGFDCYFFTNGVARDKEMALQIIGKLGLSSNLLLQFSNLKGRDFVYLISGFDIIISSRLHTSICAYSLKIPTLCLPWDEKFEEFYYYMGYSERCLDLFNIDYSNLGIVIKDVFQTGYEKSQYDLYRFSIKNNLEGILANIRTNG